jgi:hypothetical protein
MVENQTKDGGGPVRNLTVSRINVRDKGGTPSKSHGLSATLAIMNVTLDSIRMPGATIPPAA